MVTVRRWTARQREILDGWVAGCTIREIAGALGAGERYVAEVVQAASGLSSHASRGFIVGRESPLRWTGESCPRCDAPIVKIGTQARGGEQFVMCAVYGRAHVHRRHRQVSRATGTRRSA